MIGKLTK